MLWIVDLSIGGSMGRREYLSGFGGFGDHGSFHRARFDIMMFAAVPDDAR